MPSRVSLQNFTSLVDPQTTFDWAIWLPVVPGGTYSTKDFTFRCVSASIPKVGSEDFKVEAHGMQLQFPGRRIWDMKMTVKVFETRDGVARDLIDSWINMQRDIRFNTGSYKALYAVNAEANLYDATGSITQRQQWVNFYPLERGEGTLDQSSSSMSYDVSFSYDFAFPIPLNS